MLGFKLYRCNFTILGILIPLDLFEIIQILRYSNENKSN